MYSQTDLNDAVAGGAITQNQANSLRRFVATRNGAPTGDEEHLRFVLGFNDIFVALACLFALIAVAWIGSLLGMSSRVMGGMPASPFAALFVAGTAWGLAEIFTRKRHTALPSILLAAAFPLGIAFFLILLLASSRGMGMGGAAIIGALSFALGAGAAFLHWKRFHVPISIALTALLAVLAVVALVSTGMGSADTLMIVLLIFGLGVFFWAMWWDSQDPLRHTERAEVAFWLHWLAGGLILNALATLFGVSSRVDSAGGAIAVLIIYVLLTLVALAVNRKVYLLAGLQPVVSALKNLIGGSPPDYDYRYGPNPYGGPYGNTYSFDGPYPPRYSGGNSTETTMLTILIIAILFVLLALYWAPVRRAIVGMLPESLRSRLPATGTEPQEAATTFD